MFELQLVDDDGDRRRAFTVIADEAVDEEAQGGHVLEALQAASSRDALSVLAHAVAGLPRPDPLGGPRARFIEAADLVLAWYAGMAGDAPPGKESPP